MAHETSELRPAPVLREARDADALDLIELIGSVFAEYPHCVLDVDGEMPELRGIDSWARAHGGKFWLAEWPAGGRSWVVGMVGMSRAGDGFELKKLYVHRHARVGGLGSRLLSLVETSAREAGGRFVELWSDTRFVTAHAFYKRRGYEQGPHTRELHDKSNSVEFYFRRELARERGGKP